MRLSTLRAALSIPLVALFLFAPPTAQDQGAGQAVNHMPNASFELVDGRGPEGWRPYTWGGSAEFSHSSTSRTGGRSVQITSSSGADVSWGAVVPVRLYSRYRLSAWIKTEDLQVTNGRGAQLNLHAIEGARTRVLTGTNDWTKVEMEFDTGRRDAVQVNCLFGGWGLATGTAWFDDVSLELLETRDVAVSVTVDTTKTKEPISPYIYGQFIEHLGRCIYGGIWAEMLEDRKFFYPIENKDPWETAPQGYQRLVASPWDARYAEIARLVNDEYRDQPVLELKGMLRQSGLALKQGKEYNLRITFKGTIDAIDFLNANSRPGTFARKLTATEWKSASIKLRGNESYTEGVLYIICSEPTRIAAVSIMPSDNVHGLRKDTLALLKELDSPVYRWPGGNFVSGYDWRDGIGDPDKRPTRTNPAWSGIETNDFGLHEFMVFCREIGSEPFIAVNTGLGTPEEAAEEVEYCNALSTVGLGKLRAENGDREPYKVKFWAVGNEMYGSWQLGNMPLSEYTKKHNATAEAMRRIDPNVELIAVGAVGTWSRTMLTDSVEHMELISEHLYRQEGVGLLTHTGQIAESIKNITDAHRAYRRELPSLKGKDVRIALDEWNYWYGPHVYGELGTRYFLKDALGVASGLHEFFRNSDIVYMANYAQTVNVIGAIKTTKTAAEFATTGQVLKLYRQRFGAVPVAVEGESGPLDVSAALSQDGKLLTVAIVNATESAINVPLSIEGFNYESTASSWIVTGPDPMSYNEPGKEPTVLIEDKTIEFVRGAVSSSALSVLIIELKRKSN